jgi:branched-subunit amino acid aminotransferase/4-amino-4-deoxychorismate lyase
MLGLAWDTAWANEWEQQLPEAFPLQAIRFFLLADGRRFFSTEPYTPPIQATLIQKTWIPLRYPTLKTTLRASWLAAEAGNEVLWVQDGLLLETTRANIVARVKNRLLTPPLDGRILPGITRQRLLKEGVIEEAPVREFETLFICSALRVLTPATVFEPLSK